MKKIIYFIILLFSLLSATCSREPDIFQYSVSIKNLSNHELTVEGYSNANNHQTLIFANTLNYNENSSSCEYWQEFYTGFPPECVDSIVFKLPNGKGYISRSVRSMGMKSFPNKDPFWPDHELVGNNTYEFIVTEEDYNNAFDID